MLPLPPIDCTSLCAKTSPPCCTLRLAYDASGSVAIYAPRRPVAYPGSVTHGHRVQLPGLHGREQGSEGLLLLVKAQNALRYAAFDLYDGLQIQLGRRIVGPHFHRINVRPLVQAGIHLLIAGRTV